MKNSLYFKNSKANTVSLLKKEKLKKKEYITELNALKRIEKFNNFI